MARKVLSGLKLTEFIVYFTTFPVLSINYYPKYRLKQSAINNRKALSLLLLLGWRYPWMLLILIGRI
jgi:hypothetical protein